MRTFETAQAPHRPPARSLRSVMLLVCAALLPGTLVQAVMLGSGVIVQVLLCTTFALLVEAVMLRLRGQPLSRFLFDGSALVTAWLFALCIPPLAPWWIAATGMLAAIGMAKQAFGGLGRNPFNPAMVGYVLVLLCWPLEVSRWGATPGDWVPGVVDSVRAVITGAFPGGWDAVTGATPLTVEHELMARGMTLPEIQADARITGSPHPASWSALAFALGGLALCALRVVDWRTPLSVIGGIVLLATPPWILDGDLNASPLHHLLSGGPVLAAFFIASDPVSGAGTARGRWLFGFGFAALVLVFRAWGPHPDGIAFAILLMNGLAPLIDRYTAPRRFGQGR